MRIMVYTHSCLPVIGGAELVVHHLCEGFVRLGHQVLLATFQYDACRAGDAALPYDLVRLRPLRGSRRLGLARAGRLPCLYRLIRRFRPDVVHAHFATPCGADLASLHRLLPVPWVLTCHGEDILSVPAIGYGYRLIPHLDHEVRKAVSRAGKLVAVSPTVESAYHELGQASSRIRLLPNPIADDALQAAPTRAEARKVLGIPDELPCLLAVGRNHAVKGYARFLAVLAGLRDQGLRVGGIAVGRGVPALRGDAEKLGVADRVFLHDAVQPAGVSGGTMADRMETFYAASDLCAVCSESETFGLVAVEAVASGRPVVAFRSAGGEALAAMGLPLHRVNDGDIPAFVAQVRDVLATEPRLSTDAPDRVGHTFGRVAVAARHVELYRELTGETAP